MPALLGLFIFIFCLECPLLAKENAIASERIIGSSFKNLAKAFLFASDIRELKKSGINKLERMDEEKFKRRYAKAYAVLKGLPQGLKDRYGIAEDADKRGLIKKIESLDKPQIYQAIDAVPDAFIAAQFREYLAKERQKAQRSAILRQINQAWAKIIKKIKG